MVARVVPWAQVKGGRRILPPLIFPPPNGKGTGAEGQLLPYPSNRKGAWGGGLAGRRVGIWAGVSCIVGGFGYNMWQYAREGTRV